MLQRIGTGDDQNLVNIVRALRSDVDAQVQRLPGSAKAQPDGQVLPHATDLAHGFASWQSTLTQWYTDRSAELTDLENKLVAASYTHQATEESAAGAARNWWGL